MIFIIFCLLVSFYLCDGMRCFRFKNGTFIKGNKNPITLSGSLHYDEISSGINVYFYGMDYSTMIPIYLALKYRDGLITGNRLDLDRRRWN